MINEHSSAQSNNPSSANMQYGYPTSRFDFMNMSSMQNPNDVYPYYAPNLYQPFSTFDEQNQWGSTDTSTGIPPPGPLPPYHPQMYTPSGLDMSRNAFDYQPAHPYPHYHPAFTATTFSRGPSTGTSAFDMPWNSHNLSLPQQVPVGVQQQIQPIGGGLMSNKKPSAYDDYSSTSGGVGDMLAQRLSSLDFNNNPNKNTLNSYNNGKNEHAHNLNALLSKEQQSYQSNSSNHLLTRPSQMAVPSGPKSYASVVSSDTTNSVNNNKMNPSISNLMMHSTNERPSTVSNDTMNPRSNNQQARGNNPAGYSSRYQQHQSGDGDFPSWTTNNNADRPSNNNNTRRQNVTSSRATNGNQDTLDTMRNTHQYNPKDFNLNPKGARFFVIKSYSEDDIHRSIKYNIWCSTEHGNKRLDTAFREREGKGPIYLFFSVNASGHFCGMAEMMSPVDYEHQTDVWHMSNKWQGKFEVKWIYVKDVPNQQFRNIRLENNENKPVTNSRDTQEVPFEKGKLMLKTLHMYRHKTSIFDDFLYYESKQAEETSTKQTSTNQHTNNNNNKRQLSSKRTPNNTREEIQQPVEHDQEQ